MLYKYTAINKNTGFKVSGTIELGLYDNIASNIPGNLILLQSSPDVIGYLKSLLKRKMSMAELGRFFGHLAGFQRIGVDTVSALNVLKTSFFSRRHIPFVNSIISEIETGKSVSSALQSSGAVPPLAIGMIQTGETTGDIEGVYKSLEEFYKRAARAKSNVLRALVYPAIVGIMVVLILIYVSVFLIPKISLITEALSKGNLPMASRIVFSIFAFLRKAWWTIPLSIFITLALVWFFKNSRPREFYGLILRIPVVGTIFRNIYLTYIFMALKTFQANGIDILTSLDYIHSSIKNPYVAWIIKNSADMVRIGESFSKSMPDFFPPEVKAGVAVGEKQGLLEENFNEIYEIYNNTLTEQLKGITQYVEIVLIFLLGVLVLMLALAVFVPIYYGLTSIKF